MWQYDLDGNHELDEEEFVKLVSDLIDGTAKLPMAAQKSAEKVAARGIVMSMDDLFGSDDEAPPAKGKRNKRGKKKQQNGASPWRP